MSVRQAIRDLGRAAARRWADTPWFGPAVLAGLFMAVLGALLLIAQQRAYYVKRRETATQAESAARSISLRLESNHHHLARLADALSRGGDKHRAVRNRAESYLAERPELVTIGFVEADRTLRWAVPRHANEQRIGGQLPTDAAGRPLERAEATGESAYSQPFIGTLGATVFHVYVPVRSEQRFTGAVVGIYSCQSLLRQAIPRRIVRAHRVGFVDEHGSAVATLQAGAETDPQLRRTEPLPALGGALSVELVRYQQRPWGGLLAFLAAVSAALVLAMAWGMWSLNRQIGRRRRAEAALRKARDQLEKRVRQRTADLEAANQRLEGEVAERQRAEQRSREHLAQLAHAGRLCSMGELAASLAHELNQPLGAIGGYAQGCQRMLDNGRLDRAELRSAMRDMNDQAQRAGQIIHRLREFVRHDAGQRSACDVRRLARNVAELLEVEARQRRVDLEFGFAEQPVRAWADPTQIEQVLMNLMRNAIEAMEDGPDRQRRLRIAAEDNGQGVRVDVADTGSGCDPEALERAFEAFYTTKAQGMGMGLAISRSIVEAHGGRLWAEPNQPRGMIFRFTLQPAEEPVDANRTR